MASVLCAQDAGTIPRLLPFLGRTNPVSLQSEALHALYNLCKISRTRQEAAAVAGVVPRLIALVSTSPKVPACAPPQVMAPHQSNIKAVRLRAPRPLVWLLMEVHIQNLCLWVAMPRCLSVPAGCGDICGQRGPAGRSAEAAGDQPHLRHGAQHAAHTRRAVGPQRLGAAAEPAPGAGALPQTHSSSTDVHCHHHHPFHLTPARRWLPMRSSRMDEVPPALQSAYRLHGAGMARRGA